MSFAKLSFYFFKLLGIGPVSFKTEDNDDRLVVASSRLDLLENLAIMFGSLLLYGWGIASAYARITLNRGQDERHRSDHAIEILGEFFVGCFAYAVSFFSLLFYTLNRGAFRDLLQRLIDLRRQEFHSVDTKLPRRVFVAYMALWLLFLGCTLYVNVWGEFSAEIAVQDLMNIFNNCLFVQYNLALVHLAQHFRAVNDRLRLLVGSKQLLPLHSMDVKSVDLAPLRRRYVELRELARDLASFADLCMLLGVAHTFVGTLYYSYYSFGYLLSWKLDGDEDANDKNKGVWRLNDVFTNCAWIAVNVFTMGSLTRAADWIVDESQRTGEIINESSCDNDHDKEYSRQVEQFSRYLMLKTVRFDVYGLFNLSGTLLLKMAGTVATYLVIIFQFGYS